MGAGMVAGRTIFGAKWPGGWAFCVADGMVDEGGATLCAEIQ
jgi:hypothetical protein